MSRRAVADLGIILLAALLALAFRAWIVTLYTIPTASMLPALLPGDYVVVERWRYGPAARALARRLNRPTLARLPARGDVIVFRAPPLGRQDYVKRLIGLPGDRIELRRGAPILNGRALPRWRVADLIVPVSPSTPCRAERRLPRALEGGDGPACRYPRYRELLPDGRQIDVLDFGPSDGDDFGPVTVPAGHIFVLGDNRDVSADSRFPPRDGGAVGMVPIEAIRGRARIVLLSLDGSARLRSPESWWRAIRPGRGGVHF